MHCFWTISAGIANTTIIVGRRPLKKQKASIKGLFAFSITNASSYSSSDKMDI